MHPLWLLASVAGPVFAQVDIADSSCDREAKGRAWLLHFSEKNAKQIAVKDMFANLRDVDGACPLPEP